MSEISLTPQEKLAAELAEELNDAAASGKPVEVRRVHSLDTALMTSSDYGLVAF